MKKFLLFFLLPLIASAQLVISPGGPALPVGAANGGTGIANNAASTITVSGNFGSTLVVSGAYSYTLPGATSSLAILGAQTFTGAQTLIDGSAGTPSIKWSDGSGWFKGTGVISLGIAGAEAWRFGAGALTNIAPPGNASAIYFTNGGVQSNATLLTLFINTTQIDLRANTIDFNVPLKLKSYTVAGKPSASTAGAGALIFITDYASTAILGLGLNVDTAGGGGSGKVICYSDSTNWIVL